MTKTLPEAVDELGKTIHEILDPPVFALLRFIDRMLRRWPWLYRKLGGVAHEEETP